MRYELEIHVWPHETFAYYSKGHHSPKHFRSQLRRGRGIAVGVHDGDWEFCFAKMTRAGIVPLASPAQGAFPVTVWSAAA